MTLKVAPLKRVPLHMEVARLVRDMIIDGSLVAGEHIKELALCEQLQVSRTPLREALKVLASEGLVVIETNRGSWVANISGEEYFETFEIISSLERKAAELAVQRASDEQIDELYQLHCQMEFHFEKQQKEAYFKLNEQIHKMIIAMSGNQKLQKLHEQLIHLVARGRFEAIGAESRWQEAMAEHVALMDAIKNRDGQKAGEVLQAHVMQTGNIIRAKLLGDAPK